MHQIVRDTVVVVVTWLVGASVFFFAQWSSGFNRVMGNTGDTRLIVYLNEQWFLTLKGSQPWRSPPFFYPVKGLLGYTDTFFLWQLFFVPFRLSGAEPFLAFQLTIIALSLVAFVCFVIFVRIAFQAPLFVAAVGALVFTFANNLSEHVGSPQMFGIYFVPPIALLALISWRGRSIRPGASVALGALVGLLFGLLLFSTYYVAWFSLFAVAIVSAFAFVFAPRAMAKELRLSARSGWRTLLGVVIGFGVGIVPFVLTYLPVVSQLGVRKYSDAMLFAAKWNDVINVGSGNLAWGHLLEHFWSAPRPASYEVSYALTPVLLLFVVVGGTTVLWVVATHRSRLTPMLRLALALCCTTVLFAVLPVATEIGSAWVLVWHLPGATAIRAIDRIQVASDLVAALALVAIASEAVRHWGRLRRSTPLLALGVALLCLIAAEQASNSAGTQLRRSSQIAMLAKVPKAPAGCTSFFVTDSTSNKMLFYEFQTQAMLISQRIGVPTINGYSGDDPPGWNLTFPESPSYRIFVRQWTDANGLTTGVCDLDLGAMSWDTQPQL
jgi:hypothetical protein